MWLQPSIFWIGAEQLGHFLYMNVHLLYLVLIISSLQFLHENYVTVFACMSFLKTNLAENNLALLANKLLTILSFFKNLPAVRTRTKFIFRIVFLLHFFAEIAIPSIFRFTQQSLSKVLFNQRWAFPHRAFDDEVACFDVLYIVFSIPRRTLVMHMLQNRCPHSRGE